MLSKSYNRYSSDSQATDINVSPLIDMVFILLIFFIVTTSFVKEAGITVEKPSASTIETLENQSVMIAIGADGDIYMGGEKQNLLAVRGLVKEQIIANPEKPVVIIADKDSRNSVLVDVMDECKIAGAKKISLATEKE